jgi:hypothetical protein
VVKETENIIQGLELSNFFKDHGIEDYTYATNHILEILSTKDESTLNDTNEELFTENEFNDMLNTIIVGSHISELKELGFMDSYNDENNDEIFFITEEGKISMRNSKEEKS